MTHHRFVDPTKHPPTATIKKTSKSRVFLFATRFVALAGNLAAPKTLDKKQAEQISASSCHGLTLYKMAQLLRAKKDLYRAAEAKKNPRQVPKSKESLPIHGGSPRKWGSLLWMNRTPVILAQRRNQQRNRSRKVLQPLT
jgi:hypothetical protein